jgi:hypothetical protein
MIRAFLFGEHANQSQAGGSCEIRTYPVSVDEARRARRLDDRFLLRNGQFRGGASVFLSG